MNNVTKIIGSSLLLFLFVTGVTHSARAQAAAKTPGDQTVSFKVSGMCLDCKHRIESAAMDAKGVKKAEWDPQSDVLVLVGSAKMDKQKVALAVSKAGYRSELAPADPKAYAKLPACCQYDSGNEKH